MGASLHTRGQKKWLVDLKASLWLNGNGWFPNVEVLQLKPVQAVHIGTALIALQLRNSLKLHILLCLEISSFFNKNYRARSGVWNLGQSLGLWPTKTTKKGRWVRVSSYVQNTACLSGHHHCGQQEVLDHRQTLQNQTWLCLQNQIWISKSDCFPKAKSGLRKTDRKREKDISDISYFLSWQGNG